MLKHHDRKNSNDVNLIAETGYRLFCTKYTDERYRKSPAKIKEQSE